MYKEWEYIYNTNIKGLQEYDYIKRVQIIDETDGNRRVILDVEARQMTPNVWREIKR